jgi:fibronectin-binding autotransporter adhesin
LLTILKSVISAPANSFRWFFTVGFTLALLVFAAIGSRAQLVWSGANNGNWDITTTNWLLGATSVAFANGTTTLLNDSASGTTTLALAANLVPASIVVSNTSKSYTLGGSGYLTGATGLVKLGTNTLTINAASNTFTGAFIVSNGIVIVTNLANGGAASAIGASPNGAANWKLAGGTFSYRGAAAQIDRGYLVAGNTTLDVQGDLTLSGAVSATAGTFSKSGAAKLTYRGTAPNQLTGNGANYQVGAGTIVFDGTAGGANTCSGQMFIGYNQANSPTVIFTNIVFTNNSWFAIARGNGSGGLTSTATFYNSTLYCTNVSLGYANGVAGNNQVGTLTLNGASKLIDGSNSVFNLSESGGSTCAVNLNGTSWI